jgi:tRNA G18 (ribose-2'-O)-methylase SpoU
MADGDGLHVERIETASDPRLADYRDIGDAELRRRHGLFIAESRSVVRRLLEAGRFPVRSILLTATALDGLRDALLARTPRGPLYVAPHEVIRAVTGFDFHRGCLAIGERGAPLVLESVLASPGPRTLLVLDDLSNPDNVGGVFRNAMAFGADAVLLSPGCADPLYRKAIRTSLGSALVVPFAHLDGWTAGLRQVREAGYTLIALTPDPAAVDIGELWTSRALSPRVALALGAEGPGLSEATRSAADLAVRIPMAGPYSLNVATAAGIALHRLRSRPPMS